MNLQTGTALPNAAFRSRRSDSVAGVRGLELGNVPLQKTWPNSLVFRIFSYQRLFALPREKSLVAKCCGIQGVCPMYK
jgi:hypothetical protein